MYPLFFLENMVPIRTKLYPNQDSTVDIDHPHPTPPLPPPPHETQYVSRFHDEILQLIKSMMEIHASNMNTTHPWLQHTLQICRLDSKNISMTVLAL